MIRISVVVVCYNEKKNIKACLDSLLDQTVSGDNYEVLVIDNDSTDGTKELVAEYERQHPNFRLIVNTIRGIAGSRNMGIKQARFDYVAYTDADCVVQRDWLEKLALGFERHRAHHPNLAAVGSSNVPPPQSSRFYDGLRIFLTTYLGSHGSVQGMTFDHDRPVDHLPTVNVLYDKSVLLQLKGFDLTLGNIGEDQDLSFRVYKNGFLLYYIAGAEVLHKLRPNFQKWLKNMFTYGKGRMWLLRKHPDKIKAVLLAPALLFLGMVLAPLSVLHWLFLLPLGYFPAIMLISLAECLKRNELKLTLDLFVIYVGTHLAYGMGEWYGLFKNRPRKLSQGMEAVTL